MVNLAWWVLTFDLLKKNPYNSAAYDDWKYVNIKNTDVAWNNSHFYGYRTIWRLPLTNQLIF